MSAYKIVISVDADTGFITVSWSQTPRQGETSESDSVLIDGSDIWLDIDRMLQWLRENPGKTPDDWKRLRLGI